MKYCPNCGAPLDDDIRFCGECGFKMPEAVAEPVVEEVAAPVAVAEPVVEEVAAPVAVAEPVVEESAAPEAAAEPVVEEAAPAAVVCPACGAQNAPGDRFCLGCGRDLSTPAAPQQGAADAAKAAVEQAGKAARVAAREAAKKAKAAAKDARKLAKDGAEQAKKLPKGALIGICAGAAAVVIALIVLLACGVFGGGGSNPSYAAYIKDAEIFYTDFGKDKPLQVTSRLVDSGDPYDMDFDGYSAYLIGNYTVLCRDGSRMFYPDKVADTDTPTIYYRDLGKDSEPQKLDSDIALYAVNEKGNNVVYLKGDDGKLYRSNLKDKEKLASDVTWFTVTEDLKTILYQNDNGDLYFLKGTDDKEKVSGDVDSVVHVTEDLKTIYYIKGGDLYMQQVDKDRVKIASDVDSVINVWDSGELYFTRVDEQTMKLWDLVDDDMAAHDAAIFEPEYPDYPEYPDWPYYWDYETDEEYEAAKDEYYRAVEEYEAECDRLDEEYDAAYDQYWEKWDRDSIRASLDSYEETRTAYDLYFYDGTEAKEVATGLRDSYASGYAADSPVVYFNVYNDSSSVKLKMSELEGIWDVSNAFYDSAFNSVTRLAIGASVAEPDVDGDICNIRLSADGTKLAMIADVNEENTEGDLYTAEVKGSGLGKTVKLDEEVYPDCFRYLSDGRLLYFKNVRDNHSGDMFLDGAEVDFDVYLYNVYYSEDLNAVLYLTDYKESSGTLKILAGSKPEKISDDVHSYDISLAGDLYYLYDYNTRNGSGELYLYGKKNTRIDEDVAALLPTIGIPGTVCGFRYYW